MCFALRTANINMLTSCPFVTKLFVAPMSYPLRPSKTHVQKNSEICNNRLPLHMLATVYLKSPWAEFYRWLYTFSQK